jgi:hypothetical protein
MGGAAFFCVASGKTMGVAFKAAVKEAQHEYGHAGYTGTIAEKSSARQLNLGDHWLSHVRTIELDEDEAEMFVDAVREHADPPYDKWGPADAFEIAPDEDGKRRWVFFGDASQ